MASSEPVPQADPIDSYAPSGNGDRDSYRLAFDESVRTLDLLDRRVERIHTGYVAVLAFTGSGSAFLAGSVLSDYKHSGWVVGGAALASAAFLGALALAVWDLWPRNRYGGEDTLMLVRDFIERDIPASYRMTLAVLSIRNAATADEVVDATKRMSKRFAVFLLMASLSVVLWLAVGFLAHHQPAS